jgi:hypothetical protein
MTEGRMNLPGLSRSGGMRLAVVIAASLLAAGAWAQSSPKMPTPLPVPKTAAPATAPAETPAPAAPAPAAGTTTAPAGPRDPFEPLVRKAEPGEGKVQEVANLRLVGIIWDAKDAEQIRALVETPDGLGYYLRLNDEKFGGKVVALERDRVRFVVREDIPGAGTRERTVELRLPRPDGQ